MTGSLDPKVVMTKNGLRMMKAKCAVCGKTKCRFLGRKD